MKYNQVNYSQKVLVIFFFPLTNLMVGKKKKVENEFCWSELKKLKLNNSSKINQQMNDLLINAQGQCYINTNMKFLSISVLLKHRFIDMSKSL